MSDELSRRATDLDALAVEIRSEVEQAEEHWQSAVHHAIRAAELLIKAKAEVKYGEWLPWLEANAPKTPQTASSYMRLARRRNEIENASSISEAVALLAAPKKPKRRATYGEVIGARAALQGSFNLLHARAIPADLPEPPGEDADHLERAKWYLAMAEHANVWLRLCADVMLSRASRSDGPHAVLETRFAAACLALAERSRSSRPSSKLGASGSRRRPPISTPCLTSPIRSGTPLWTPFGRRSKTSTLRRLTTAT